MILELATSAIILLNSLKPTQQSTSIVEINRHVDKPITLENYVREYFNDAPILAEIAKCETRFRQNNQSGRVLRGELTSDDVGIMQINEFYHNERAEKLGFNLHTLDGNLAYAKWLYAREGVTPWLASSKCWKKYERIAEKDNEIFLKSN